MTQDKTKREAPESLVAILIAARQAGLRDLERVTRQRLEESYGVRVSFPRAARERREGGHGAQ